MPKATSNKKAKATEPVDNLADNTLAGFLNRSSTLARLQELSGKYGAGAAMRLKTLVLKHATPALLEKNLGDVTEEDLTSLPRTGKLLWQIFQEIRTEALKAV